MNKIVIAKRETACDNRTMNALKKYFENAPISQAELSRRVGTTPAAVCRWVSGAAPPSAASAIKIAEATGGAVKASDILPHINWEWAD